MKALLLVACAILTAQSLAWWSTGHMIVAKVAMDDLLARGKTDVVAEANDVLLPLVNLTNERDFPLVEASVWNDDIKAQWKTFNHWHFVDWPFVDPDFKGKLEEYDMENATYAINEAIKTLKRRDSKYNKATLSHSIDLRMLIHFIGDVHQPLHSTTYYSEKFPKGDRGGNSFKIYYKSPTLSSTIRNLHALWDACVDQFGDKYHAPLSADQYVELGHISQELREEFSRSSLQKELSIKSVMQWTQDAEKLSEQYVYPNIEYNGTPSKDYLERGQVVVRSQLTLAGYRLADKLEEISNALSMPELERE